MMTTKIKSFSVPITYDGIWLVEQARQQVLTQFDDWKSPLANKVEILAVQWSTKGDFRTMDYNEGHQTYNLEVMYKI